MNFEKEIQASIIIKQMLTARGYTLEEDSKEEFIIKGTSTKHKIISFICKDDKLSIQGIKEFVSIMNKENCNRCIIVYRESVTSSAKKSLDIMEYNIELFGINELQFNITEHRIVPKHEKVTKEEKDMLDKEYKNRLPIILHTDPVSRYYFFQRGEYIRITRKDGAVLYRIVK